MNFGSESTPYENVQTSSNIFATRWYLQFSPASCCDAVKKVDICRWWFLVKLRYVDICRTKQVRIESMNSAFSYLSISIFTVH